MKILKGILIAFVVIIIVMIVMMILMVNLFGKVNTEEQEDMEKIITGGDKKALILYQESRGNLVKKNVEQVSATLQNEGYSITMNHPRQDSAYVATDYDIVVLATPVYAATISQPLCDYADRQDFSNVKVFLLVTGNVEEKNEVELLQPHVKNAKAISSVKTGTVLDTTTQKLKELILQ